MNCLLLPLATLALVALSPCAFSQVLPVTTTSEEARRHFELGRDAAFHYQFEQAVEHLDAAIAADSTFVLAYLMRGGSSTRWERGPYFESARRHRDRVTPAEQVLVDAFHAFLWDVDIERAVELLTRLDEEHPDDPYVAMWLGLRYHRHLGRHEEARYIFERALQRDPTRSQAHLWVGQTALALGDLDAAEEAFQRYVELSPEQPRPWHALGQLYLARGEDDAAGAMFERASRVDARFTDARESLMRLRIGQANQEFEDALSRRDAAALAATYTPAAELMPPIQPPLTGPAIEEFWREQLANDLGSVTLETREVIVGDPDFLTTEIGRYQIADDTGVVDAGSYVVIWARTADGWKRHRHVVVADGF